MADDLMSYLAGKQCEGFKPGPFYSPDGDFLTYYFREDEAFAERVDDFLTIYRSMESRELVGCKIQGVRRLLETLRSFGVAIETQSATPLNLLFLSAGSHREPAQRKYYEEIGRFTCDVPLDARELQLA